MTAAAKRFPLQDNAIKSVPWWVIESHRKQAMSNHGQTLERLAERGGLSVHELYYVLADKQLGARAFSPTQTDLENSRGYVEGYLAGRQQ